MPSHGGLERPCRPEKMPVTRGSDDWLSRPGRLGVCRGGLGARRGQRRPFPPRDPAEQHAGLLEPQRARRSTCASATLTIRTTPCCFGACRPGSRRIQSRAPCSSVRAPTIRESNRPNPNRSSPRSKRTAATSSTCCIPTRARASPARRTAGARKEKFLAEPPAGRFEGSTADPCPGFTAGVQVIGGRR